VTEYPGQPGHPNYIKVPTALLYDKANKPIAFGWEAENKRATNPQGFTKRFKLGIAPKNMREKIAQYPTPPGITQIQCISDYLSMLKDFALDTVLRTDVRIDKSDPVKARETVNRKTQWVITVPAIWTEEGKSEMRAAANRAGMTASGLFPRASPLPLQIALEPEAAALRISREDDFQDLMKDGDTFEILDIGGGTTDIVNHRVKKLPDGSYDLQEVIKGAGALVGGSFIDDVFLEVAETKIPNLSQFSKDNVAVHQKFMDNWDAAKRGFVGNERFVVVELPAALKQFWFSQCEEEFLTQDREADDLELSLTLIEMKEIFEEALENIVRCALAQRDKSHTVTGVLPRVLALVGGLSESSYIQNELTAQLRPHFELVFTPPKPGGAVVFGATAYGLGQTLELRPPTAIILPGRKAPPKIDQRIMRKTYAINSIHGLVVWVKAEQPVPANYVLEFPAEPETEHQDELIFEIYSSEDPNFKQAAPGQKADLEFHLALPLAPGQDRFVNVKVCFGGTHITIEAVNLLTNEVYPKYELKFLDK